MALKTLIETKETPELTEGNENVFEGLEQAIIDLSEGMKKLRKSRLSEEAIIVLLQNSSRVKRNDIRAVLNALDNLERHYLKARA